MAQTSTVQDPVNTTAVDLLSGVEGKIQVAHFFLTANTDRDPKQALAWLDKAAADLEAAKNAITTSEARELRRPVTVTEQLEADL